MKANELRIGNWMTVKGFLVIASTETFKHVAKDGLLPDTKPIPLTEEWLIKFGFEDFGGQYKHTKNTYLYLFKSVNGLDETAFTFSIEFSDFTKDLQYIHQLQNLYFALTGQELTITDQETKD